MYNKRAMPRIMAHAAAVKQCKFDFGDGHFSPQLPLTSQGQSPLPLTNNNKNIGRNDRGTADDELDREIGAKVFVHRTLGKAMFVPTESADVATTDDNRKRQMAYGPAGPSQFVVDRTNGVVVGHAFTPMAAPPAMALVILPGIANDVECFPCRVCCSPDQPQRVFLTRAGLEKHAAEQHPQRLDELSGIAQHIQNVWASRRWHQRHAEQSTTTAPATALLGTAPPPLMPITSTTAPSDDWFEMVANDGTVAMASTNCDAFTHCHHNNNNQHNQECAHWNALIESRRRGHRTDEQLAQRQMHNDQMGTNWHNATEWAHPTVPNPLVPSTIQTDEVVGGDRGPNANANSRFWPRRRPKSQCLPRRYMCHWCARIFDGIAQLNAHKQRDHRGIGMATAKTATTTAPTQSKTAESHSDDDGQRTGEEERLRLNCGNSDDGTDFGPKAMSTPSTALSAGFPGTTRHSSAAFERLATLSSSSIGNDAPAKIQCNLCGLVMVRPSLLIRHMARVHRRHANFDANVVFPLWPSVPPLRYAVDERGQLSWLCCEHKFADRASLLRHRATVHYYNEDTQTMQKPKGTAEQCK